MTEKIVADTRPPKLWTHVLPYNKTLGLGMNKEFVGRHAYHVVFLGMWNWRIDLFRWKVNR